MIQNGIQPNPHNKLQFQYRALVCFMLLFFVGTAGLIAQVIDRPLARVRLTTTTVITQRQVQSKIALLEQELEVTLSRDQKMSLLNSEIDTELIMQAAARASVTATEQEINQAINQQRQQLGLGPNVTEAMFRQIIEQQAGMSWAEYRETLRRRIIQEKFIVESNRAMLQAPFTPSESDINRVYQENINQFLSPAFVRFEHLFIDTRNATPDQRTAKRQQMEGLLSQVRSGGVAAFTRLIQASVDDASFAGGDFGFLPRGEQTTTQLLGRSFIDQVFNLQENTMSGILESNLGFHIVRITQKREPRLLTMDDPVSPGGTLTVRQQISQFLQAEALQERMAQAVTATAQRLRNEADVQIFNQNINW